MRNRTLVLAAELVGLGVASLLTGWQPQATVPLLVIGLVYAGLVLVMD